MVKLVALTHILKSFCREIQTILQIVWLCYFLSPVYFEIFPEKQANIVALKIYSYFVWLVPKTAHLQFF